MKHKILQSLKRWLCSVCTVSSVFNLLSYLIVWKKLGISSFWYFFLQKYFYNFQGKWPTCLKCMFEECMPIKTSMVETIEWHPYFIKTDILCILKCYTFDFFSWKNIFRPNLSNNEIKPKRNTYTRVECLLFLKYYLMKTYDVNGNCEIYN